ncbi:hypothetical protein Tco_1061050 [Tanacetum coccineum]
MNFHVLQEGCMEWDDQREVVEVVEVVEPLVDGDVEEDGDLSLEAMEDEEVALVYGVFEGAFSALGDEWWCISDGVEALVDAMDVMAVDDE